MTPEALAALHATAFADTPRPWTAAEFADLLGHPGTLLATRPCGFALGRVAGPEAELLTLAVHPDARRRGIATGLVAEFEAAAAARGAEECLLEVAVTNAAALALYVGLGYSTAGWRPAYYRRPSIEAIDALVLRKHPITLTEKPLTDSGR
jgi:ribosomal-protein-alanine N-acetyltransferase